MAINKKLIFWNNSSFNEPTSPTDTTRDVLWNSIVFFGPSSGHQKEIWTHGVYFSSPIWGTETADYVPVTISGVTKNLSLNGHTHSYLPLSGGTITGSVSISESITNLSHNGGGIFWNPYAEADSDGSDVASISVATSGGATVMSIKQMNDENDYINFLVNSNTNGVRINNNAIYHAGNFNPGNYLSLSGGTMDGPLNFKNNTWNSVGDDVAIGDVNVAGQLGIKALNTINPGIAFYDNSNTTVGNLISNAGTLQWNWNTVLHASNYSSYSLPLSGGTLTGQLTLSIAGLTTDNFIKFKNDTQNCYFGIRNPYGSYGLTFVSPDGTYNKVWHSGNDGAGSGLDADMLDGQEGTYYHNNVGNIDFATTFPEGYTINSEPTATTNPYSIIGGNQATILQVIPGNIYWGAQFAIGFGTAYPAWRNHTDSSTWSPWQKISAGYADNAGLLNNISATTSATANTIVQRDNNGFIYCSYINCNRGLEATVAESYIYDIGDGWLRKKTLANVQAELVTKSQIESVLTGNITSHTHNFINSNDSRDIVTTPETINIGLALDFKAASNEGLIGEGGWMGELTYRTYGSGTDWSGGPSHQLAFASTGNLWHRIGSSTTWNSWYKIWDSNNSNLTTVPWSVSTLTMNGALTGATTGSFSSHVKIGGGTNDLASTWDGGLIVGNNGHDKIVASYLASATNAATIGAHNSGLMAWAKLNVAGSSIQFNIEETPKMLLDSSGNLQVYGTLIPNYLTLNNPIISSYESGYWINSVTNAALNCNYTGYGGIFNARVKDGRIAMSTYPANNNSLYFGYATDAQIAGNINYLNTVMFWDAGSNLLHVGGFCKENSSDSYVLLGGGGHAIISGLNVATASVASQIISTVWGTNSIELVRGNMADNDQFRILVGGTSSNEGYVEIATADDATEPIYVRQYGGVFEHVARSATLLDASGNTNFPGSVTANGFIGTATNADTVDNLHADAFIRVGTVNGYYGLAEPGGGDSNWIRTTSNGIIPYQSGGYSSLGTDTWPFSAIYSNNYYGSGASLTSLNASNISSGTIGDARLPQRLINYTGQYWIDANNFKDSGFAYSNSNLPTGIGDANILGIFHTSGGWGHQLVFKFSGGGTTGSSYDGKDIYTRLYNQDAAIWTPWYVLLSSGNYSNILNSTYRPMGGSWSGNNVPGTREFGFVTNDASGEVAFKSYNGTMNMIIDGNIYVTDSSYEVIHAGNIGSQSVNYATTSSSASSTFWLNANSTLAYGNNGFQYFNIYETAGAVAGVNDTPTTTWWHIARFNHANSAGYYTDLAIPFNDNSIYYKRVSNGTVINGGWVKVLDTINYSSYSPTLSGGGASGTWNINITGNASNATNISNTGTVTLASATESNAITITQPSYTSEQPVKLLNFNWYTDTWSIGNIRSGNTPSNGLGIFLNSVEKFRFIDGVFKIGTNTAYHAGNFSVTLNGISTTSAAFYAPTSQLSVQSGTQSYLIGASSSTSLGTVYSNASIYMIGSKLYAGDIQSSGNIIASNVWNTITITKNLTVGVDWMDTGIDFNTTNFPDGDGTYAIEIYTNANSVSSIYYMRYSGVIPIFTTVTNSTDSDEISLTSGGHATNNRRIYARIQLQSTPNYSKLQIACSHAWTDAGDITFKFKKLI